MKVPRALPQFEGKNILVISTGAENARIFEAKNGTIEELENFRIPKPHYSDREGFFETRGHGAVFQTGAVYENKKETIIQDFISEFKKKIKKTIPGKIPDHLYIFCPRYFKNRIQDNFTKDVQKRVEIFYGNYARHHPFELLKKIASKMREKSIIPTDWKAAKILKSPEKSQQKTRKNNK